MDEPSQPEARTFAAYAAQALIAKKGYRLGTVPEARLLFDHCDAVLTRADGQTLAILCIVDREKNPERRFGLSRQDLEKIGTACLPYTGRAGFRKLPVRISVAEIGREPAAAEDTERLQLLKTAAFSKVQLAAFALAPSVKDIWTNAPLRGRLLANFFDDLMRNPKLSENELAPKPAAVVAERRPLILTYCLLAGLAAVFALEYAFQLGPAGQTGSPDIRTLVALGALDKSAVLQSGEWWRLFTAPPLHGGPAHILLNGVALFFAGAVLENVVGRAWFAAVFALTGVAGTAMSLALNPATLISVGASGAIMGLFAAAFAISYRYPVASPLRTFLQSGSLRVLIPSLIPLFDGLFGQKIDFAAHLGGAIAGAVIGAFLAAVWRKEDALPPFRAAALFAALACLSVSVYGGVRAAEGYRRYDLVSKLIPPAQVPKDFATGKARSAGLAASFPGDPRSHMYRGLALMEADELAAAEAELRAAVAEKEMLETFFDPELERFIRANLAMTLKHNGKESEARATAQPLCVGDNSFAKALANEGLCP
jgi:rhomboid protease GluP